MTFVRLNFKSLLAMPVILIYAFFAFHNLTTYPRLWLDEGFKMQLSRNFAETGKMAIQFPPGNMPYTVHNASTGWPVVVGLGIFFKIFGVSFATARTFSVLILLSFLTVTWLLVRKKWGDLPALLSLLLLVTYAPLFVNGKMVLAELPGLLFLSLAFLSLIHNSKFVIPAIFFGLFAACKLSFAATFLPALFIGLAYGVWKKQIILKNAIYTFLIALIVALPTIYMTVAAHVSGSQLANSYGQVSLIDGALANLRLFLHSSTLWHFLLLLLAASWQLLVWWRRGQRNWTSIMIAIFILLISAYWLASPAVFRYLLPAILLLLVMLPIFMREIFPRFYVGAILMLVLIQGYHFATAAAISHGESYTNFEEYLRQNPIPENASVGVINSAFAPVLIPRENMRQFFRIDAIEEGINPLSFATSTWPEYLIYEKDNYEKDVKPYQSGVEEIYKEKANFKQIIILQRK